MAYAESAWRKARNKAEKATAKARKPKAAKKAKK